MSEIGSVTIRAGRFSTTAASVPVDESVGGMLFDISGFDAPFEGHLQLIENFGSSQVQLINSLDDAAALGLKDDSFLNGLVWHHLSMFYDYVGNDAPLYLSFADCSTGWGCIVSMQKAVSGKMFQLGIWTSQPLWDADHEHGEIVFSSIVQDIEEAAEELSGKSGVPTGSSTPLSIILSANTNVRIRHFSLQRLPDGTACHAPKLSVLLGQDGSDAVHGIQQNMPGYTPVGMLGVAMAVLSVAGAEENIGSVMYYDLNKNDQFEFPEIAAGGFYYELDHISNAVRSMLTRFGYIIPITYPSKSGSCYFCGDPTLSTGAFSIISNNRVLHKCRRAIYSILLSYLHGDHLYESVTGGLTDSALQMFEEAIGSALSGKLINKGGKYQIDGYQTDVIDTKNILKESAVSISYVIKPANYNGTLTETVTAV